MNIKIILEGKIRHKWTASWIEEYQKRLSAHTPLEVIEWGNRVSAREEKFFKAVMPGDKLIALDEGGRSFADSHDFAKYIGDLIPAYRNLYLFVGEATGHSEAVLRNVSEKWSLSGLTMSYEVALIMLAEQLYRSMTIRTGHPYHK